METQKRLDIVVDFDGTCVSHEFPKVGYDIGAAPVLKELVSNGHRLILFTMRSDRPVGGDTGDETIVDVTGNFLTDAINWFKKNAPVPRSSYRNRYLSLATALRLIFNVGAIKTLLLEKFYRFLWNLEHSVIITHILSSFLTPDTDMLCHP